MKNIFYYLTVIIMFFLSISACKKDDPDFVMTINGENPTRVMLGSSYNDAGATTNQGVSVSTSGSVDVNRSGTYEIAYSAIDKDGTTHSSTRLVDVFIERAHCIWSGYSAQDSSFATGNFTYNGNSSTGIASNEIIISNFSGLGSCTAIVNWIPAREANDCGGAACVSVNSQLVGPYTIKSLYGQTNNSADKIYLKYTRTLGSGTPDTCQVWLSKI